MKKVAKEEKEETKVCQGSVIFYNQGRGFGFIKREGMDDLFFHHTGIEDSNHYLQMNDIVTFEVADGQEGKEKAVNVRKVEEKSDQIDLPPKVEEKSEEEEK